MVDPDVLEYRFDCPEERTQVSPLICKTCKKRMGCIEVQKLLNTSDLERWKGTILGSGVDHIINFRKQVVDFVMGKD